MGEREVAGWVWAEHVHVLLRLASGYLAYVFDDVDWQAVEDALGHTDNDSDEGWFEYPLLGSPSVRVRLARDPGGDEVSVRIVGAFDDVVGARLETLLDVLSSVRPQP